MKNNIIHGDCLEIIKDIKDESIDAVITDPPYNTGMTKKNTKNSARLNSFFNDSFDDNEYKKLANSVCKECYRVLKKDSAIYIFINWKKMSIWKDALEDAH